MNIHTRVVISILKRGNIPSDVIEVVINGLTTASYGRRRKIHALCRILCVSTETSNQPENHPIYSQDFDVNRIQKVTSTEIAKTKPIYRDRYNWYLPGDTSEVLEIKGRN
jgi:hypothetical protein